MNYVTPQRPHPSSDDLQARLALNLTARLSEQADHLPHDLAERLRVAREQAVERVRHSRRLAAGMVLIDRVNVRQEISAAAEIDAALLADDLPPAAYLDPGFSEFLKSPDGP